MFRRLSYWLAVAIFAIQAGYAHAGIVDSEFSDYCGAINGVFYQLRVVATKQGNPADGQLVRLGDISTPSLLQGQLAFGLPQDHPIRKAFESARLNANPKVLLDKQFVKVPQGGDWKGIENSDGTFAGWKPDHDAVDSQNPHIFYFDSFDQFRRLAKPNLPILFQSNLAEPGPNQGKKIFLVDCVGALLQKFDGEKVVVAPGPNYGDECLFVSAASPTQRPTILWLPKTSTLTPTVAYKAFAFNVSVDAAKMAANADSEADYARLRSCALFANEPDLAGGSLPYVEVQERTSAGTVRSYRIYVKSNADWAAQKPFRRQWQVRNSKQKMFRSASPSPLPAISTPVAIEMGRTQVAYRDDGYTRYKFQQSTDASLIPGPLNTKLYYAPSLKGVTSKGKVDLLFSLVTPANNEPPFYLQTGELTVREFTALLNDGADPAHLPFWATSATREAYGIDLAGDVSAAPEIKSEWLRLRALIERPGVVRKDEYEFERQFAAWVFHQYRLRFKEDSVWAKSELYRLVPYFAMRQFSWGEIESDSSTTLEQMTAAVGAGIKNVLPYDGDLSTRYSMLRDRLRNVNFLPFPSPLVHPLDEPVVLLSPKMIANWLGALGESCFRLPGAVEWATAARLVWNQNAQGHNWTGDKQRAWPFPALHQVVSADESGGLSNLIGNVSELVTGKDGDPPFGAMGANYRSVFPVNPPEQVWPYSHDQAIPVAEHASSPAIGLRLVFQTPETAVTSLTTSVNWNPAGSALWLTVNPPYVGNQIIGRLYRDLWGETLWGQERDKIRKFLGDHEFWFAEHLRTVLYGPAGYPLADLSVLINELPPDVFLKQAAKDVYNED